jgi:DTW domain-containing protein YfiP
MARSVVLQSSVRCERCYLPLRWCVCAGVQKIESPLQIDVLIHHREQWRPSSTGHLVNRTFARSRQQVWRRERMLTAADVGVADRELWILHPRGEPLPAGADPSRVQALMLDGSWREASAMAKEMGSWGRLVSLPMTGPSRYWLRAQQPEVDRFSTAEAVLFLLEALGLTAEQTAFRVQFELHVYAGLKARGYKAAALKFLENSPLPSVLPDILAQLEVRRPR